MVNYALVSAFVGNIIVFVAGTALTWSSPVLPKLNSTNSEDNPFDDPLSDGDQSWIGSLVPLGAAFGPFLFGFAADKFGRKLTIAALGVPFGISYLILAFINNVYLYFIARFVTGMAVGGVFTVIPMYVGEIAEDSNRGALGSAMNCFICAGLLFSYCVGPYLKLMWFNLILAIFPIIFIPIFITLAPETPHHHVSQQNLVSAEECLAKVRGSNNQNNAKELEGIKKSIESSGSGSAMDIFRSKGLRKCFIISLALVAFQQFSGINAVLFYAQTIFEASGSSTPAEVCSIIIGCVQFSTSFITPFVADRLGRKLLLIVSATGMLLSEIPLGLFFYLKDDDRDVSGIQWLPVVSLIVYIITYNFGFGPLPWAVMGELFPSNVKSIASSMTAAFCWFIGFLITKFFTSLADSLGMGPSFWMFSGFCLIALLFSVFYLVETKGKSVQEIQEIMER